MLSTLLHALPAAAVLVLAAWTLLAEAVVAAGGNLFHLEALAAITLLLAALARWRSRSARPTTEDAPRATDTTERADDPSVGPRAPLRSLLRLGGALVVALGLVLVWRATDRVEVLVLGACLLLLAGLAFRRGADPLPAPSTGAGATRAHPLVLVALALLTALVALGVSRPDADDAFYLNVPARAAHFPGEALMADDGIFGIAGMPVQYPLYRAHGIELLVGALAHLSGLEPILIAHYGLVALFALLLPLAHARLLGRLVPHHVTLATVAVVAFLLVSGEGERSYGHFALLRLHQGKGILLALGIPMVLDAVLRYAALPDRRRWLQLSAAQIACVGLSSSALFLVPVTTLVALAAAWRWSRPDRRLRQLALGLAASWHAVLVALWLLPAMATRARMLDAIQPDVSRIGTDRDPVAAILTSSFGDGGWLALTLVLALAAWAVPARASHGRLLAVLPLLLFAGFLAPWSAARWIDDPFPLDVFVRVMWIVPWPVLAAVTLVGPLQALGDLRPSFRWAPALTLVLVVLLPWGSSERTVLGEHPRTTVGSFGPKVPAEAYEAARILVENTPENALVLAADDVATWVSTFRQPRYVLYSRYIYEPFLRAEVSDAELRQRRTLVGFVSRKGIHLDNTDVLCYHAEQRDLRGIVLRRHGTRTTRQLDALADCGFRRAGGTERYEVWVR